MNPADFGRRLTLQVVEKYHEISPAKISPDEIYIITGTISPNLPSPDRQITYPTWLWAIF
jgi:hypothetical protein